MGTKPGPKPLTRDQRDDRNALIFQMFISGWSMSEIQRHPRVRGEHPITVSMVHNVVKKSLEKLANRHSLLSDKAMAVYVERTEALIKATWPQAMRGDLKAIETCRRLLEQQGRLYDLEEEGKVASIPPISDQELMEGDEDGDELAKYRKRHRRQG